MAGESIDRRDLLRRAVIGTGAIAGLGAGVKWTSSAAAGPETAPSQDESPNVLPGVVERIEPPRTLVLRNEGRLVAVEFEDGARFWKDRPVRLEDFVPGDEVTIEGDAAGPLFIGNYMTITYRTVDVELGEHVEVGFKTPAGTLELLPQAQVLGGHRPGSLEDLATGDYVTVIYRADPASDHLMGIRVGRILAG